MILRPYEQLYKTCHLQVFTQLYTCKILETLFLCLFLGFKSSLKQILSLTDLKIAKIQLVTPPYSSSDETAT